MPGDETDRSIFEAVARRRKRSSELDRLAKEKGVDVVGPPIVEEAGAEDEALVDMASVSDATEREKAGQPEGSIDEQLIANLGSGKNDYGVLEDLIPQIDFDAIPLTQPKRVKAKSGDPGAGVLPDDEGKTEMPASRAPKRKKKPASLLDSYFKGM